MTTNTATQEMHDQRHPERVLLTAEEAAHRLSISRTTMYQLLREGKVQSIKVNRCRRVPVRCLQRYIDSMLEGGHAAS